MIEKSDLELRMFGLVPYNISPIQQGIQYGHSKDQFTLAVIESLMGIEEMDKDLVLLFYNWLKHWKTYIILNGGTTNDGKTGDQFGTMNIHLDYLREELNIDCFTFREPDLGGQLTGIVFIVDERVFDRKKYPDFRIPADINEIYTQEEAIQYREDELKLWINTIGGEKNVKLREFIRQFRLA